MMKLVKTEEITKVQSFKLKLNELYFCSNDKLFNENKKIKDNVESQSFWIGTDYIFFHNTNGDYICDFNKNEKKVSFSPYWFTKNTNNEVLASYDYHYNEGVFTWKIGKFQLANSNLIEELVLFRNCNFITGIGNIIIGFNQNKDLFGYDLDLNKEKFKYVFKNKGFEFERILDTYQNQLLVGLKDGLLIALDIDTGALLWQTQQKVPIQNLRLSESEGILYGLQLHKFVTINAKNGAILVSKDIEPYLDSYFGYTLFLIRTSKLYNGLIYFIGGRKAVSDTIGIFDPIQEKIIWHYQLELPKGELIGAGDDKIQITDTKLYVLDTTNTLHIFEREQDEV